MTLIELAEDIRNTTVSLHLSGVRDSPSCREQLEGTSKFLRAYLKGTEEANSVTANDS